jgi:hypothetical protein
MHPGQTCSGSDHRAPETGGSCPCGMVTRIPPARPLPVVDVRDVVARCLYDGPGDPLGDADGPRLEGAVSLSLRQQADRLLAALAAAGLELAHGPAARRRPAGVGHL